MIISDINEQVAITEKAMRKITFKLQEFIVVIYKIAAKDYEKEIVETEMQDLEEMSKEEWIQDRYDYYMSKEFLDG